MTDAELVLSRLEVLYPVADALGMTERVSSDLAWIGRRDLPMTRIRGVRGLVVAASPAAPSSDRGPVLTITHEATGLAALRLFYDADDDSERNKYALKDQPTRLERLRQRRAYEIPVTARGLAAAKRAARAIAPVADWTEVEPVKSAHREIVAACVLEAAWPHLRDLADADDRAEFKRIRERSGEQLARAVLGWVK